MSRRLISVLFALLATVFVTAVAGLYQTTQHPVNAPAATPQRSPFAWKTPEPPVPKASVLQLPSTEAGTWEAWALLDRDTGMITQAGGKPGTSPTMSMIKVAIAAQYLSDIEVTRRQPTPADLRLLSVMIRDSDNAAAELLYRRGGRDRMLQKVVTACGLRTTLLTPARWSQTQMTPLDAVKMGDCIAKGKVCSQGWADWIIYEMRQVRGYGRFGPVDARPAADGKPLAIKNGYYVQNGQWHVNCLAVAGRWVLAVMTRYPAQRGIAFGAGRCAAYTAALAPPDRV